ncbi:hypothetical protein MKW98_028778 [Papaver atlanticum]|uniref:RING-type domain-containing protein n=1 Tax=Papaver atlanticum TaxID=357466 RepID=A0AAD4XC49_9MAGN|nr:hypothetical protein MKW98_028778 [Papaver atlanticum]
MWYGGSIFQGTQLEYLVCLDEFGDGDKLRLLPCHHVFHAKCIDEWFACHPTCAVCRFDYNNLSILESLLVQMML